MLRKRCIYLIAGLTISMAVSALAQGDPYTWPKYNPTIHYDFNDDNPNFPMPTKNLEDDPNIAGSQASEWWVFHWGPNANPLVTEAAITPMLERFNKDFKYFREVMGWPPDKRAQRGYRSAIYLYGSGLGTDNASNTDLGGWQSSTYFNGESWSMCLLSYYPVYCFDPSCSYGDRRTQMGGCVHEGIHCILADLPGCRQAGWFHEGGNTWLQQYYEAEISNNYNSMGFLNCTVFLAPFMPIECYSGWLQDGSFGGPTAEGVNMSSNGQQICTWRDYIGGTQYSNAFPTWLGEWLGVGAIPWIWKNCLKRVLEGMASGLGDEQLRRLIMEYRAKQALIDMKKWSNAYKSQLNRNFGRSIGPEGNSIGMSNWIECATWKATPYAKTTNDGSGLLTPEERTTPGWSGANQIPLTVASNSTMVTVEFQPIGQNMSCQLAYRADDGTPVYSTPVTDGTCSLRLDKAPGKGVVIAVICNTDYVYEGEETRKAHYDYRLKLVSGISGAADIYTKWYDVDLPIAIEHQGQKGNKAMGRNLPVTVYHDGSHLVLGYELQSAGSASISMYTIAGKLIERFTCSNRQPGFYTEKVDVSGGISRGAYIIQLRTNAGTFSQTVMIGK